MKPIPPKTFICRFCKKKYPTFRGQYYKTCDVCYFGKGKGKNYKKN